MSLFVSHLGNGGSIYFIAILAMVVLLVAQGYLRFSEAMTSENKFDMKRPDWASIIIRLHATHNAENH